MVGTLYVVATPIGNLEDITLRALRVLREVDLIAAEDTRRTAHLLRHYSIATPTTSYHAHNERRKLPHLLARLQAGQSVALVSDAGTPAISDPGIELTRAALDAGVPVRPVPGPSAILAALAVAGAPTQPFTFLGFPPRRSRDRAEWFERLGIRAATSIFFEAPHKLRATLTHLAPILGGNPIIIARELTKVHEELVIGPIELLLGRFGAPVGEFTVIVPPRYGVITPKDAPPSGRTLRTELHRITAGGGLSRREAIRQLSQRYGLPARGIYHLLEEAKESGG